MGREGPSRFLFNTISFSFSSILCILAGFEVFRKSSFARFVLPPSSRLNLALGDTDLPPPGVVLLELFRRGNPFLMSLSSRSTMQPSCSSSRGRGFPFLTPAKPALAFLAASSSRFLSRALRFSSWIRNCSFSWNVKDEALISKGLLRRPLVTRSQTFISYTRELEPRLTPEKSYRWLQRFEQHFCLAFTRLTNWLQFVVLLSCYWSWFAP